MDDFWIYDMDRRLHTLGLSSIMFYGRLSVRKPIYGFILLKTGESHWEIVLGNDPILGKPVRGKGNDFVDFIFNEPYRQRDYMWYVNLEANQSEIGIFLYSPQSIQFNILGNFQGEMFVTFQKIIKIIGISLKTRDVLVLKMKDVFGDLISENIKGKKQRLSVT